MNMNTQPPEWAMEAAFACWLTRRPSIIASSTQAQSQIQELAIIIASKAPQQPLPVSDAELEKIAESVARAILASYLISPLPKEQIGYAVGKIVPPLRAVCDAGAVKPLRVSGKTPRTDVEAFPSDAGIAFEHQVVRADFARQLERECATERAAREKAEIQLAQKDQIYLERLDAFEQVTKRVSAAEARLLCDVCCGQPLPSGRACICGGTGNIADAATKLREMVYASEARATAAEAKSGDVAKALNAYPDSDLVSLATTLEAIRRKAEVVFPLAQKLVEAVQRTHIGPEASDDCDVCRATKELAATLASVPANIGELRAAESAAPGENLEAELASALRALLLDTQHEEHSCGAADLNCPVDKARAVLARFERKKERAK